MNEIVSPKRNALCSKHILSLIFINSVGLPVDQINTIKWIESWIKSGKIIATEENCPKIMKVVEKN